MKKVLAILSSLLILSILVITAAAVDLATVATVNGVIYTDISAALLAVDAQMPEETVVVLEKAADALTIEKTTYLDLNGFDVASVTVESGATLYCLDSETDDYIIAGDAQNGYTGFGRILAIAEGSESKVAGVEAGMIPVIASEEYRFGTLDSYLMVKEDAGISFHRVNLQITAMTLRPKNDGEAAYNPGVYYKSNFAGDQLVADNVDTFGIALSVQEMPTADNMGVTNQYSWFTADQFQAGVNDGDATSTYLKYIMQESNPRLFNTRNSLTPVFGRAYLQTDEGKYIFGVGVSRTLQEQIELLSQAETWNPLGDTVKQNIAGMYRAYKKIMKSWNVQPVKDAYTQEEEKIFRVLNISNSHGSDAVWHIPTVLRTEEPGFKFMIAECYFSGALTEHLENAYNNAPVYKYWTSTDADRATEDNNGWHLTDKVPISYALEQEQWDYVMFNESSRHLGLEQYMSKDLIGSFKKYIDQNLDYEPKLLYNMTWSNPNDDRFHEPGVNRQKAPATFKNTYTLHYGYDYVNHYNKLVELTEKYLINDTDFEQIIFNATPIQFAQTKYGVPQWDDEQVMDLYRDYTHLSDFARLMVAYNWYVQMFGIEELTEVNVDVIPTTLRATDWQRVNGDLVITDAHKEIIIGCINHTLKHPLTVSEDA